MIRWNKVITASVLSTTLLGQSGFSQPAGSPTEPEASDIKPPVAKKIPKITDIHGATRVDNYFWLREKSNPEVIKYLQDENAYTEAMLKPAEGLQETLYQEMLGRIKQTDLDVPYRVGTYFYYSRTEEGKQYPTMCRKKGSMNAPEEVLLDLNDMVKGFEYLNVGDFVVSDDNTLLAYTVDTTGYRQYTLYIKDLHTGKLSNEVIERVSSVVWATDNRTLFYTTEEPVDKRSDQLWRHTVGADRSELLYEERDNLFDIEVARSLDKKVIFLSSGAKTSSEVRYLPADQPTTDLKTIVPREPNHEYDVDHYNGQFYIRTNKQAKNFCVVTAPVNDPREKNWQTFIPHNPAVKLSGLVFFAHHCVVAERENGLSDLRVIDMKTRQSHRISFPEPDYALFLDRNPEYNTSTVRFKYESQVTPSSVFDYDMNTRKRTLLKQQDVLGGYDKTQYRAERIYATASDGTQVPISLVYKKGLPMDGKNPLLLYGYGSYGISQAPTFSSERLSLLDRGVIYAKAYIRGGGEMGEAWREQGRMMKKMTTFTDFIDCAEALIRQKYTSSDRLVIQGGSAGGLLVGAVANLRPDLFKAVIAAVPFVDVINTMLDPSLPLTTSEYLEWGNPNEKPAFDYMRQYSPYDNVKAQDYPAMLIEVSLNDSQVPYWEGAKFVAKLRATKTDTNLLLLKANMGAGHSGSSGRYSKLHERALEFAFMLSRVGITK